MSQLAQDAASRTDATSQVALPRAISTVRFVGYLALVTAACLAWQQGKFWFATPAICFSGLLLRSQAELRAPVKAKWLLVGTVVVIALIGVVGLLVNWVGPYVSRVVTKEQFDAIGMHPAFVALAWFALVYVGAMTWRRQLKVRDA